MKKQIKTGLAAMVFATVMSAFAAEIPLAQARTKIGDAVADSKVMAETMKSLSAANQKAFVAEVNAAISRMPGSAESKAATFLAVNRAALKNAANGNLKALIVEIFATAPVEVLTVLNESFAKEFFSRDLAGNAKLTDVQFEQVAKDVVSAVSERVSGAKDADVRTAFMAIMFIRAASGKPADIVDKMVAVLPEKSRDVAKSDWIPAALGQNQEKSYDPMLGSADAGREPDVEVVILTAGPQILDALLADMVEGTEVVGSAMNPENVNKPMLDDGSTIPALPEPHGYSNTSTGWTKN